MMMAMVRIGCVRCFVGLMVLVGGCAALNPDPAEVKEVVGRVSGAMEQQARVMQTVLPVGGTLTTPGGQRLTVERVGTSLPGTTAPDGQRLVVLDVSIANPGTAALPFAPEQDLWMTDLMGRRSQPLTIAGLPSGQLAAGSEARGQLAFPVFNDAIDLRFGWQQLPTTVFEIK